jgi:hypothetical protein
VSYQTVSVSRQTANGSATSGRDVLGEGGVDSLNTQDGISANGSADGGSGADSCVSDPETAERSGSHLGQTHSSALGFNCFR